MLHKTVLLLALAALSPATAGDIKVSGLVTYRGKPVEAGKILFHLGGGEFVGVKVGEDGKYSLSRVPEGTWPVTVEGTGIPAKYTSDQASGLKATVKKGSVTLDIELK